MRLSHSLKIYTYILYCSLNMLKSLYYPNSQNVFNIRGYTKVLKGNHSFNFFGSCSSDVKIYLILIFKKSIKTLRFYGYVFRVAEILHSVLNVHVVITLGGNQ